MKACFKEKMMRQYNRARISLAEMVKPMASDGNTILCQNKENDHFPGVLAKIEVETSYFCEFQGTEKSTSNSLVLQSPTQHEQSTEVIEVGSVSSNLSHKVRKKAAMTRYTHSDA